MKAEESSNSGFFNPLSMEPPPFYSIVASELYGLTCTVLGAKDFTKNLFYLFNACLLTILKGERPSIEIQGMFLVDITHSLENLGKGFKHLFPLMALMSVRSYLKYKSKKKMNLLS